VADDSITMTVDLHPMHMQIAAHLKFLEAVAPVRDQEESATFERALEVLRRVDKDLQTIMCRHMGIRVVFKP